MASFTFKSLQQTQLQLSSFSHCKCSSTLNTFKFHLSSDSLNVSPTKRTLKLRVNVRVAPHSETRLSGDLAEELSRSDFNTGPNADFPSGFSFFTDVSKRGGKNSLERNHIRAEEPIERRVILKDRHANKRRKEMGSGVSSMRFKDKNLVKNADKAGSLKVVNADVDKRRMKCENNGVEVVEREKRTKKPKVDTPEVNLRIGLDLCSKRGDVMGAIKLYELARKEGIKMGQYHYAVLLYLCSSAATGVVQPAKSGSGGRSLSAGDSFQESSVVGSDSRSEFGEMAKGVTVEVNFQHKIRKGNLLLDQTVEGLVESMKKNANYSNSKDDGSKGCGIQVSKAVKGIALRKGFEIYNEMRVEKVAMNEATLTSVARMAMAIGDGDMAFDMVKQMKEYGINPRLRSYGPALAIFCSNGDVEKAFMVEKHMLEHGVYPEEPELEALLKVSVEAGKSDKVYYVLHKLRISVRQVSSATAKLIERWFKSKVASRVGKRKWDQELIIRAMENGGGGWHGKGWLGKGKWTIRHSPVDSDGLCKSCGAKLVTIDLDPMETENFAKSVAAIAAQREKKSSFQKFQVNAVVNGIRQMLPSRKWPLIVLHNRRITGEKMDEPFNKALIEKWRNADALYATPTGSNDDWYWLYAAIKYRCLIVTNDEMRDHLFQLLGTDFFPKWKERHQESEKGHWHIPIVSELENEDERIWLCCTRANSCLTEQDNSDVEKGISGLCHLNSAFITKILIKSLGLAKQFAQLSKPLVFLKLSGLRPHHCPLCQSPSSPYTQDSHGQ
ncbi:UNVERIFIED_CONTAM: Proteinaceous RNase P 1, chloroplastic/mitochondrial [Sesamum angustifolium]|uniref:ribonuclease P n=1 Tax=Sesamum angustifolium TaxID=2727405 RepID=A0AAW2N9H7_9LAMI